MMNETPKGNILLVDEDNFFVNIYSMKFTLAGYAVEACLSANDAFEVLKNGFNPDAIVFDIIMREHDGFYFLETIGKDKLSERIAIVALTNESADAPKARAIQLGADRFIMKSMTIPSEVVSMVEEEVKKKKRS